MGPTRRMRGTLRSSVLAAETLRPSPRALSRSSTERPGRSLLRVLLNGFVVLGALVAGLNTASATESAEAIECLALTVYFEARGEPDVGKLAVAHVVVNRTRDTRFPQRICDVTRQHALLDGGCQFSWTCDEISDRPADATAWRRSKALARQVYHGLSRDPTGGALWYHADNVDPAWRHDLTAPQRIGRHMFYRDAGAAMLKAKDTASRLGSVSAPRMTGDSRRGWTLGQRPEGDITSLMKQAVASGASWASLMTISMHVYSDDKTRRFVRLNHAVYAEGDWLTPDVRLEAITPQGVVLQGESSRYVVLLQ